jgi:hypothetical protein
MCSHGDAALLKFSLFPRPAPAMQIAKRKRQPSRGQAEREAAPASPTGSPLVWWRARRDSNARPPGPQPGGPPSHPGSWSSPPRPPASAPAAVTVAVRGGGASWSRPGRRMEDARRRKAPSSRARCRPTASSGRVFARDDPSRLPCEGSGPGVPRSPIRPAIGEAKHWREVPSI